MAETMNLSASVARMGQSHFSRRESQFSTVAPGAPRKVGTVPRRGIILILVMVVVAMLALATLGFSDLMLSERRAAQTSGRQAQARALAQSGAELARQFLDREPIEQADAGGVYDNPQRFDGVLVTDDDLPRGRGRFSIVAPRIEDRLTEGARYGLQDESAKINLATLLKSEKPAQTPQNPASSTTSASPAKSMLMALPGMTEEISDAILDWLDSDDTPRENGAEAEYYAALTPPYAPRNGTPTSIEELLKVRGVTPQLLFGLDAARMGLAPLTTDGTLEGVDNSDGSMDHGWAAYLTLYSAESNLKADGTPKIDLNGGDLKKLHDDLQAAIDEPTATFIVAYRAYGAEKNPPKNVPTDASVTLGDLSKLKPKTQITNVLDLVGAVVAVQQGGPSGQSNGPGGAPGTSGGPGGPGGQPAPKPKYPRNPFTKDTASMGTYLPKLMASATTYSGETIAGRININQAPRVVLLAIPGMTPDLVDRIISERIIDPVWDTEAHHSEIWPLCEGVIPFDAMKPLLPFITAGGSVYRAQILGSFDSGSPTARIEVVLDASKRPTQLLFWKDISRQPQGFPVEPTLGTATTGGTD